MTSQQPPEGLSAELSRELVAVQIAKLENWATEMDRSAAAMREIRMDDAARGNKALADDLRAGVRTMMALAARSTSAEGLSAEKPHTIYDHRTAVLERAERAGPRLYVALKNLLDAVEERPALRESIESITLSDAHAALDAARSTSPAPDPKGGEPPGDILHGLDLGVLSESLRAYGEDINYDEDSFDAHALLELSKRIDLRRAAQ